MFCNTANPICTVHSEFEGNHVLVMILSTDSRLTNLSELQVSNLCELQYIVLGFPL